MFLTANVHVKLRKQDMLLCCFLTATAVSVVKVHCGLPHKSTVGIYACIIQEHLTAVSTIMVDTGISYFHRHRQHLPATAQTKHNSRPTRSPRKQTNKQTGPARSVKMIYANRSEQKELRLGEAAARHQRGGRQNNRSMILLCVHTVLPSNHHGWLWSSSVEE